MNEVGVQDHLVKVKSSVDYNSGNADWSIACDVCCLAFYVLAILGASYKVVELFAAVARVDIQRVAAGVSKLLKKQRDKSEATEAVRKAEASLWNLDAKRTTATVLPAWS